MMYVMRPGQLAWGASTMRITRSTAAVIVLAALFMTASCWLGFMAPSREDVGLRWTFRSLGMIAVIIASVKVTIASTKRDHRGLEEAFRMGYAQGFADANGPDGDSVEEAVVMPLFAHLRGGA